MTVHDTDPALIETAKRLAAERRQLRHGMRPEWLREGAARPRVAAAERQQILQRLASAAGVDLEDLIARRRRDRESDRARLDEWQRAEIARTASVGQQLRPKPSDIARRQMFPGDVGSQAFRSVTLDRAVFIGPAEDDTRDEPGIFERRIISPEPITPMNNTARVFKELDLYPTFPDRFVVPGADLTVDFLFAFRADAAATFNVVSFLLPNGFHREVAWWWWFFYTKAAVTLTAGMDVSVVDLNGNLVLTSNGTRDVNLQRTIKSNGWDENGGGGLSNDVSALFDRGLSVRSGEWIVVDVWADLDTEVYVDGHASLDYLDYPGFGITVPAVFLALFE